MRRMVIAILLGGLALAGLSAKPAAADWEEWWGQNCDGNQITRCAGLDWDRSRGIIRARGNLTDNPNGGNYQVAVNDTMVQVLPFGGPWTTIDGTRVGDFDGWHPVSDDSASGAAGVWCGFQYRALTYHRWTGASNGSDWVASEPVTFC